MLGSKRKESQGTMRANMFYSSDDYTHADRARIANDMWDTEDHRQHSDHWILHCMYKQYANK